MTITPMKKILKKTQIRCSLNSTLKILRTLKNLEKNIKQVAQKEKFPKIRFFELNA